ncbi:hypothetical protein GE21DRAFT_9805 [Neurospora crassa]|uniref:Uncharacterized protein n=1 Tax=Neurospora crassa (strain ATCC 24698 / 74-OR23-1A / CBS 708.71 / DSM 1257 / FGSC 987) TaxID=367110 RepID=Q7S3F2_NEUCR|nr:hypothetical protein NCU06901 [Neurospora crassa OR74A]EAA30012.1 hypothetical protein NCU06901 [Neurospora crassa OR74A]KHE82577.1 hypothetical protein GE21DRAFT_9805 [Neurospora crassa]|eukprot:XP_959248.1 hypothetical protein NCU06901 [Neurospora crassa OR74A]
MDSTIEVTERLERLSIATNLPSFTLNEAAASPGPSRRNLNLSFVSSETSTQVQTATASTTTQGSDNDVTMSDDLITATRNLSLQSRLLQNRSALDAHGRGHAEWSRLCNQRSARHGTVSIAMMNIRARERQAAQAPPRSRPRPRPRTSSREAREEAGNFFRHCAQIQSQTIRAHHHHHHHHRPRTPPVATTTSGSEAAGLTREEHHQNLFRAQLRCRLQIRMVSAIAARAGH